MYVKFEHIHRSFGTLIFCRRLGLIILDHLPVSTRRSVNRCRSMQIRDQRVTPSACSSIACNRKRDWLGRRASWTYTTLFIDHVPYTAKTRRMFYSAHKRTLHVADWSIDIRRRCLFLQALRLKVSKHSHRVVRRVSTTSKIVFPFVPLCHDLGQVRGHYLW